MTFSMKKMVTYEKVVMDFLKEKFGSSIAEELIKKELKLRNLNSISDLNSKDQVLFIEKFMRKRYSQFLSKEEVDSRILQLNLHYCSLKASEKISNKLKKNLTIEPFDIKIQSPTVALSKIKSLSNNSTSINLKLSGDISAESIFFFDNKNAQKITSIVAPVFGVNIQEEEVNKNVLKNFLNVLLPTILESTSQFLGNSISFTFDENELDLSTYSFNDELVFFSEIPLILNNENLTFNLMTIIKK